MGTSLAKMGISMNCHPTTPGFCQRNGDLQQARIVNWPVRNNHEHITIYIYIQYIYILYIYRVYIYVTAIYHMNIYMNITHIHTYVCCARYCACTILVVWVLAGAQSKYNQQFGWWTLQPGCQGKICKQYLWRWNLEWLQLHMSDDFYLLDVRSQED